MSYLTNDFNKKIQYELNYLRNTYLTNISEKAVLFETHAEILDNVNEDLQSLAYEKVYKEEIAGQLLMWADTANPNSVKAMLDTPNLLDCVYIEWLDSDYSISEEIENTINDFLHRRKKEQERQEDPSFKSEPERGY